MVHLITSDDVRLLPLRLDAVSALDAPLMCIKSKPDSTLNALTVSEIESEVRTPIVHASSLL